MNIFVLDECPQKAAQQLCDKHVVKMALESAQILCTVARLKGYEAPYKMTHKNHPCTAWVNSNINNWHWLVVHGLSICIEYTARYKKLHKCEAIIKDLNKNSKQIWKNESSSIEDYVNHTKFVQCMPDEYKKADAIEAYKHYYCGAKNNIAKWTAPGIIPDWFKV